MKSAYSPVLSIYLVGNHNHRERIIAFLSNLDQKGLFPLQQRVKRILTWHIKHKDGTIWASIKRGTKALESWGKWLEEVITPLLTSSIPDLQGDGLVLNLNLLAQEISTNGRLGSQGEFVVYVSCA